MNNVRFFRHFCLSYWRLLILHCQYFTFNDMWLYFIVYDACMITKEKGKGERKFGDVIFVMDSLCNCNIGYLLMDVRYDGGVRSGCY